MNRYCWKLILWIIIFVPCSRIFKWLRFIEISVSYPKSSIQLGSLNWWTAFSVVSMFVKILMFQIKIPFNKFLTEYPKWTLWVIYYTTLPYRPSLSLRKMPNPFDQIHDFNQIFNHWSQTALLIWVTTPSFFSVIAVASEFCGLVISNYSRKTIQLQG